MAAEAISRPAWTRDVDAETMFYCSQVVAHLYGETPNRFGDDSRAAMCLAKYAAQYFEQLHPGGADHWTADDGARDFFDVITKFCRILYLQCRKQDFIDVGSADEVKAILRDL